MPVLFRELLSVTQCYILLQLPVLLMETSSRLPAEVIEEVRGKLSYELREYNLSHPTLHVNLYDVRFKDPN